MGIRSAVSQPLESRIPFVDSRIPSVSQQWYRDSGEPSSSMKIGLPVREEAKSAEFLFVVLRSQLKRNAWAKRLSHWVCCHYTRRWPFSLRLARASTPFIVRGTVATLHRIRVMSAHCWHPPRLLPPYVGRGIQAGCSRALCYIQSGSPTYAGHAWPNSFAYWKHYGIGGDSEATCSRNRDVVIISP